MTLLTLLTRPRPDSERCAADLHQRGFETFIEPMLIIDTVRAEWPKPSDFNGIIVTSAHALEAVPASWRLESLPVFAVGKHTEFVARSYGFQNVRCADGGVSELESLLLSEGQGMNLLHPCGRDKAAMNNLPDISITNLTVYKATAAKKFSDGLLDLLDRHIVSTVLFYSPRTAAVFAGLVEYYDRMDCFRTIKALCLSAPVVQSLRHLPWQDVRQAVRPCHDAMLELIDNFKA